MNRLIVAGAALVAGVAIASPMVAWSAADNGPQTAQTAQASSDQRDGGPGDRGWQREERGPKGGHPGWMRGMLMHRMMTERSPRQRCEERLARRAGFVAYTVAKLNLTAEQKPLWDKLNSQMQAAADKERQLCAAQKPASERAQQTILDRVGMREQFLSARLQGLQQAKPALEQLYQALTAEQKAIIDHPFRRG